MSGTIRRNDDNSRAAIQRAAVTAERRQRAAGRAAERYLDQRALVARAGSTGR
jgi:hypothetical protein